MSHRHFQGRSLVSAIALASLAAALGCGSGSPNGQPALSSNQDELLTFNPHVARVEFTTGTELPANRPPNIHVTVTDASKAQAIYLATVELPSPPTTGITSCPEDSGIFYTLEFFDGGGAEIATAKVDPGGCERVTVTTPHGVSSSGWAIEQNGDYWHTLAKNLGIPERKVL